MANVIRRCHETPLALLPHVKCWDERSQKHFRFGMNGWEWQLELLLWWMSNPTSVTLKARQIGVTWLAAALCLWHLLYKPGSRCLWVSQNEDYAKIAIRRIWTLYESLPRWLKRGKVLKPERGLPSQLIEIQHSNGLISTCRALPSTPSAGRSETAALVVLDEYAFHPYADETWTSVMPTAEAGGTIIAISTANGVSGVDELGELVGGNYFHYVYTQHEYLNTARRFYSWRVHPDRDDAWYEQNAKRLKPHVRAQEYPANDIEAFILTGRPFFEQDAIHEYAQRAMKPIKRVTFKENRSDGSAMMENDPLGPLRIFVEPRPDGSYAIAADVATGRGTDFSAATVIDLETMEFVAKYHARCNEQDYARDLHYIGRLYNTAWICPETQGGYGDAVVLALRDGTKGRPVYPRVYRHRQESRIDRLKHKTFGMPMSSKVRPLVVGGLEAVLREREIPFLDGESLLEYNTFARVDGHPSPAAQEGCNDDRVMADAIAIELYRQLGHHEPREQRRQRQAKKRARAEERNQPVTSRMSVAPGSSSRSRMKARKRRRVKHGEQEG